MQHAAPLFSTYRINPERIATPAIGDRFTWLAEQWVCMGSSDHASGRVPLFAVAVADGRQGMPFADEVHTIIRHRLPTL